MKKSALLVLFLITIICLSTAANADLIDWIKKIFGISKEKEVYVPVEEIKIEEENITGGIEETPEVPPTPEEIVTEEEPKEEEKPKEEVEVTKEEEPKPTPKKEAKVIIVKETELVALKVKAKDKDNDKLKFSYTTPLDENGKWQTTYGDAGEYRVTVTASDGQLSTSQDVLIIVNKKEEPPKIDEATPRDENLEVNENRTIEFKIKASDLNKDNLTYKWLLDKNEVSNKQYFKYKIGFDDAGTHTLEAVVSDGTSEARRKWNIKVNNVNRKPVMEKLSDIKVKETEKIVIEPKATDPDKDKITFTIDSDKFKKIDGKFVWETTYEDAGTYKVKITASDGTDKVSQEIKITIENVNRAPIIEDIVLV